jgi:hypothetical protein
MTVSRRAAIPWRPHGILGGLLAARTLKQRLPQRTPPPMTREEKKMLRDRLAHIRRNPGRGIPWPVVRLQLRRALRKR